MGLPRSTYYDEPTARADDTAIVEAIAAICDEFERYGYRRVGAALRQAGLVVNHKEDPPPGARARSPAAPAPPLRGHHEQRP